MKGGYKSLVNFSNMLNADIIDVGETILNTQLLTNGPGLIPGTSCSESI